MRCASSVSAVTTAWWLTGRWYTLRDMADDLSVTPERTLPLDRTITTSRAHMWLSSASGHGLRAGVPVAAGQGDSR